MDHPAILVVLRSHAVPGQRTLGAQWPNALPAIQGALREGGAEVQVLGPQLLARFPSLPAALAALSAAWERVRSPGGGTAVVPLQVVLHAGAPGEGVPGAAEPGARSWRALRLGALHVTEPLRRAWGHLAAGSELPRVEFVPQGPGLYRLVPAGQEAGRELHPARWLPYLWGDAECFYCGLTSHAPPSCPTRQLPTDLYGLSAAARLPVSELAELGRRVLSDPEELGRRVLGAASAVQVRKDPALAVAAAWFDLHRPYQLRYLIQLAFGAGTRWPGLRPPERSSASPTSQLQLALDCLRAGRHSEAEAILTDGRRVGSAHRFYTGVALAFLRLERAGPREMAPLLERAEKGAANREERLYVRLLLSRCYELAGDLDRAQGAADRVLDAWSACPEGLYRRVQLLARQGAPRRAADKVRELVDGDPVYWVVALLDPQVGPAAAEVDGVLGEVLDRAASAARERLAAARADCQSLSEWLEPDDPAPAEQLGTLGRLEARVAQGGYADLLEAVDRAHGLSHLCAETRRRRLRQLRADVAAAHARWEVLLRAWHSYPHKLLFHSFASGLQGVRHALEEAHSLARTEALEAYRAARARLDEARSRLAGLEATVRDMAWAQGAIAFIRSLSVRFVAFEALLIPVALLVPALLRAAGFPSFAGLEAPALRDRAVALCGGLLAPALALAGALRAGARRGGAGGAGSTRPPPAQGP